MSAFSFSFSQKTKKPATGFDSIIMKTKKQSKDFILDILCDTIHTVRLLKL